MSDSKTPRLAQSALALLLAVTGDAGALTLIDVAGGRLSPPEALDHYLYIGSGTSLDVWDIADYSAPVRVDRISLAPVCGVTLAGGYLYACAGTSQLGGIAGATLTDPAHPQFVNGRQGAPPTLHIVGVGDDLITLDGANGLQVFDTPDLFWLASSNTLLGDVREVSLQGDTLLAMGWNPNGDELLTAFDIANPLHPEPTLVEFVTLGSSSIRDHVLTRNYMIELLSSGLAVYDAHDLGNITLLSSRTTGPATRELVDGNVLYVFGDTTLQLYDLTALPNLVPLAPAPIDTSGTQEVLATGHGVLMLTNAGVATLIDDTRVATPTVRTVFELPGSVDAPAGASDGHHVFLADRNYGLKIDDATSFEPVGHLAIGDGEIRGASELSLAGNVAFVLGREGLNAIDVSDPAHPEKLGSLPTLFNQHIAVDGAHAYLTITNQPSTFAVADVSNPAAMQIVGTLAVDAPNGLVVRGTHVFIASGGFIDPAGLRVVDVANPAAPIEVGEYTGCADAYGYAVDADAGGRTVYLGCSDGSVHVLDVSNPAAPALVGTYQVANYEAVTAIAARGDTIHVGHATGVDEVDVSTPSSPSLRASLQTLDGVTSLALSPDGSLYAFAGIAGTYLFGEPPAGTGHSMHARAARTRASNP